MTVWIVSFSFSFTKLADEWSEELGIPASQFRHIFLDEDRLPQDFKDGDGVVIYASGHHPGSYPSDDFLELLRVRKAVLLNP